MEHYRLSLIICLLPAASFGAVLAAGAWLWWTERRPKK